MGRARRGVSQSTDPNNRKSSERVHYLSISAQNWTRMPARIWEKIHGNNPVPLHPRTKNLFSLSPGGPTHSSSTISTQQHAADGDDKWKGGTSGSDGCLCLIPCHVRKILKYDPSAPINHPISPNYDRSRPNNPVLVGDDRGVYEPKWQQHHYHSLWF